MIDTQTPDTQTQTVVGLFESFPEAEAVARSLEQEGFTHDDISIVANDATGEYASRTSQAHMGDTAAGAGKGAAIGGAAGLALGLAALAIPGIGPVVAAGPLATALTGVGIGAVAGGLIGALTHMGVPEDEAQYYTEGVRSGGALVIVKASGLHANRAAEILERSGAENVEEKSARDSAPVDSVSIDSRTPGERFTAHMPGAPADRTGFTRQGETTLPVAEEEIAVGKRSVSTGGVRVYRHVSQQPVAENINLREEHARVERQPADRDATEADFQEKTIEVRELAEEPVVSKRKRVVEDVIVGKDVTSRTEKITDSVRRTEVNVEKLADREPARTRAVGSVGYDEGSPAYVYGTSIAVDPRYRGKDWIAIEPEVRQHWEAKGEGAWESAKDSIRHAWDKMTGKY